MIKMGPLQIKHFLLALAAQLRLLGFGTKFVDFNLDGWLDIFIVNGHVIDNIALLIKIIHMRKKSSYF
ncbi:MAG: hypothetical protein Ct9H300mP29_2940 [Candidatus Neomarinimicrobiota bacterium]|nr:MAG: hypothetical protein Ct9H300mP29_2940 [Candidatus Neomarinimicrobiota bacterium]